MIISRTPFRISFFGGGTDYPVWYRQNGGGAVLNATINKYCYISTRYLPPFFDHNYRIRYSFREEAVGLEDIRHPSVRECIRFMGLKDGIEMVHTSDIPARSGIGSSSSFTVGFINALSALNGKMQTKRQLAMDAIKIEQDILKENVGSQDQVAAAFGGFNKIDFNKQTEILVQPIIMDDEKMNYFQDHLMLFFTGFSRTSSEIADEQVKNTPAKAKELTLMKQMVDEAVKMLNGYYNGLVEFGKLMNESWKIKKSLSKKITTPQIDDIYNTAISAGALGGKLCGAGGGGFMLIYAKPEMQKKIREKLKNLIYVPFKIETLGSQIILYTNEEVYGNEIQKTGNGIQDTDSTTKHYIEPHPNKIIG